MTTDTLDIRSINERPDLFAAVDCSFCGETAARWVHATGADTSCAACADYAEAQYSAQGGQ